jgi:hypothetical protein
MSSKFLVTLETSSYIVAPFHASFYRKPRSSSPCECDQDVLVSPACPTAIEEVYNLAAKLGEDPLC